GDAFACAIAADGTLTCWGANDAGQATPPAGTFIALSAGPATACAIAADGTLACWGADDAGQATPPAGSYISVGVGTTQACAIGVDGTPTCWGAAPTDEAPPTRAPLTQVSVGGDHACAIVANGILDCWGVNDAGQADPPVPGAPVATRTIEPQTVAEDALLELVLPEDLFTDTQPLTWTASRGDGTALPNWLRFDPGARLLSGTPTDADVGQLVIAITATDTDGLTGTTTFTIDITNTNDTPVVGRLIPDQDATEDSLWTFVIPDETFTDDDLDSGDSLTISMGSADYGPLPAWLRFDWETRTVSGTPSREDIGQLPLMVIATDSAGESTNTLFNLRIARVNHPPTVATAIKEQKAIQDQSFTFTFPRDTFAEQDSDDSLVYDAIQKDGTPLPSWLSFARSDRTFKGSPRNSDVGTLIITVTATDRLGASASTDFALRVVNVNDPPQLVSRIPDQTIQQDQTLDLPLSRDLFTDPDLSLGDTLHLRATGPEGGPLPAWLRFDADTWTFSGTPRDADAGRTVITVTATDAAGDEASGSFTLTVEDVNDLPQVSQPTPDQVAPVGQRFELVLEADMFIDADVDTGDQFTVTAVREDRSPLPAWLTFDPVTLAFAGVPGDADAGDLAVSVVATDLQGGEGVDTFIITVEPPRDQPSPPTVAMRRGPLTSAGAVPMLVTWSAGREAESGRARYGVEVRTQGRKGWAKYKKLATVSGRTGLARNLRPGTYQLRLRALVPGSDPGPWVEGEPFTLRVLSETDPAITYDGRWTKATRKDATKGTLKRSTRPGDSASVITTADSIGIVAANGDGQGQVDICVDPAAPTPGACRTVDLSQGRKSGRQLVTVLNDLPDGEHQVVTTVRQAPVDIDAIVLLERLVVPTEPATPTEPEASQQPS
ncbi:MAG: putative Ig domain-containing protein, partial [Chloroflexi bacterium]|nr:putative Ig domain-containing protein [Chloroflexota bacterium]